MEVCAVKLTRWCCSANAYVFLVALTANAMNGDKERCLGAGCDGYASKPIRRAELVRTIHESRAARS